MAMIQKRSLGIWKRNIKNTKNKVTRKKDKKWKTLEKKRETFMSTNIEVYRKKTEVRNNLDRENY